MNTGLYPNLSRAEYEAIDAINISALEHIARSPLHFRENLLHPKAPTEAMEIGTAAHCAILEPPRFASSYAKAPKVDRRTTVGKQTWAAFEEANHGKEMLVEDDFTNVERMRDAALAHPTAKSLLGGRGHNEVGLVWRNEETGLLCKGLLDRVSEHLGWTWIVDLKKTQDASPHAFQRSIKKYHYGAKAAWYLDGANAVAPRERRFAWIAIEEEAPYGIAIYEPVGDALAAGRSLYMRWLRRYAECRETDTWPGYDPEITQLSADETEW